MAGYNRLDRKRPAESREELDIFKLNENAAEYINMWKIMVSKMRGTNRIPRLLIAYKPRGR